MGHYHGRDNRKKRLARHKKHVAKLKKICAKKTSDWLLDAIVKGYYEIDNKTIKIDSLKILNELMVACKPYLSKIL